MTLLPTSGSRPSPAAPPWVLLVEDDYEDEALALRILKKYRISNQVEVVKTGEEALRLLKERLGTPSSAARAGRETQSQVPARIRSHDAGQGASLLPAAEPARNAPEAGASGHGERRNGAQDMPSGPQGRSVSGIPELVLLDYGTAPSAALEIVKRMRALPGMENVPVAVCCADQDQEREIREAARPRVSCLSKPFGFFKLLECIQKMDMHWFVFSEKP